MFRIIHLNMLTTMMWRLSLHLEKRMNYKRPGQNRDNFNNYSRKNLLRKCSKMLKLSSIFKFKLMSRLSNRMKNTTFTFNLNLKIDLNLSNKNRLNRNHKNQINNLNENQRSILNEDQKNNLKGNLRINQKRKNLIDNQQ